MTIILWTDDLNTGISVIDSQHQQIVDYINQLGEAEATGNRDDVGETLKQLVDYTISHFSFEEALMKEGGYRFINAHSRVHQQFIRRVNSFNQRFQNGEDIALELLATLKIWLINHIKNDDDDYAGIVLKNLGESAGQKTNWLQRSLKKLFH